MRGKSHAARLAHPEIDRPMDLITGLPLIERTFGPGALPHMISRPGFRDAERMLAANFLRNYKGNWLRNRLLNDRGRYLASILILDLHFNLHHGAGVTTAEVRREVSAYGVCSPGRGAAFLAGLRFGKFMEPMPLTNRKEKRLGPTSLLLEAHRDRWRTFMTALGEMDPDLGRRGLAAPDALIFGPALHALAQYMRMGLRVFDVVPLLRDYAEREAGFVLLVSLMAQEEGEALPALQAARHYSVSRTHATGLLRRAVEDGLAQSTPQGYVAGERLCPALDTFFSLTLLAFEQAFRTADASVVPAISDNPPRGGSSRG